MNERTHNYLTTIEKISVFAKTLNESKRYMIKSNAKCNECVRMHSLKSDDVHAHELTKLT